MFIFYFDQEQEKHDIQFNGHLTFLIPLLHTLKKKKTSTESHIMKWKK